MKAAVAVGVTSHSSEDMYMSGGRGKCVDILHVIGDMICQLGKPPARPQLDPAPEKIDETTDNQDSNESTDVSDNKLDSADAKELIESINITDNENNSNETVQV